MTVPLRPQQILGWAGGLVLSGTLTWTVMRPSLPAPPPPPPSALPRPASDAELAKLAALHTQLQAELSDAAARAGHPLEVAELEAVDATGAPWLPSGIPDNPLRPGHAFVAHVCAGDQMPTDAEPDWLWCPSSEELVAVGLDPASQEQRSE